MSRRKSHLPHLYAVILAGGSGTRFWPLSRRKKPKQLLRLFGPQSLLEQTAGRIRHLVPPERTFVFASQAIREAVARELPQIPRAQIVAEPASRNTAPAIGLAAFEILRRDPEGMMVVLPSDHLIAKPAIFARAMLAGTKVVAAKEGRSVVLGVKPAKPETGYGYVRLGKLAARLRGLEVFAIRQFTEKPPLAVARRYVRSGKYLWNGGMFMWKASTVVQNLRRFQPQMAAGLERIARLGGIRSSKVLRRLYPRLENISIDYALMEKISDVYAVAAEIGWSDVGSWAAAYELSPKDPSENALSTPGLLLDARRNMIFSPKKFVAAVGVDDLVIVETEDALLVCSRERSQDVGKLVRELERRGIKDLL